MRLIGLILILAIAVMLVPQSAQAISLVPCGRSDQANTPQAQCTLIDLIALIVRMINYLISVAAIVAIYEVLGAGWWIIVSMGDAEKIQKHKEGLMNAIIGFAIVVLAFIFLNLLVNGVLGRPDTARRWWDPRCIYDITTTRPDCPLSQAPPAPGPGTGPGGGNSIADLAGFILAAAQANANIILSTDADCPVHHALGNIEDMSNGLAPMVCSPSCVCTRGGVSGAVTVNADILGGLIDLARTYSFKISSLTTGSHTSAASAHYSGEAVDIVPTSSDRIEWTAIRSFLNALGGQAICENNNTSADVASCGPPSLVNHIHWSLRGGEAANLVTVAANGTCRGAACSDHQTNLQVCGPVPPGDGCDVSAVNRWTTGITNGVGGATDICSGVNAVKMLKAIVANESDGVPGKTSFNNTSFGLFQLRPSTARDFKTACSVTADLSTDAAAQAWLLDPNPDTAKVAAQACMAAGLLRSLVSPCGCDVRQLAAGYNGGGSGQGACNVSSNCGPAARADGGECQICGTAQGTRPTKRWECPWDDNQHSAGMCNVTRNGNFSQTRIYAPRVEWCYNNAF